MRSQERLQRSLLCALALGLALIAPAAQAQTLAGFSDYFILGQDEHVWNFMNRVRSGEGAAAFPTPNRLNSVSSSTATADGQRITYDHWEDGLEVDITAPVQTSTTVFGDSNNANGRVCDFSVDPRVFPCNGTASHDDVLYAGTPMTLASDRGMTGGCAAPYAVPPSLAQVRCSFPVSPGVASATRAGAVVTVTVTPATGHGYANGATVRISGANEPEFNGSYVIATAGPASLTFTYTIVGPLPAATTATGILSAISPTIRFDGGDRVFSTGGSLSIAQIQDPGTPLIGGGTELLARELVKNATSYSIPVGEDLYPGANNAYFSVKFASLDVVAFDDNTSITVTSPGGTGGVRSLVLHRGQHYSTCVTFGPGVAGNGAGAGPGTCLSGAIDGPPPPSGPDNRGVFPALALTVNAGTKIATSGPLNALIFTGGAGAYQTRHYATLPDILHATDYVTTAPGDDGAQQGVADMNLFIYNPNPTAAITVTTTDTVGTTVITIPANSVVDYRNSPAARFVPNGSGVRLTSTRPFWGLTAYDSLTTARDWGHAWLGVRFLRTDYTAAYSPGTQVTQVATFARTASPGCVATITTGTAHFLTNNSIVRVSGVSDPQFNGTFTLTAAAGSTISYTIPACVGGVIGATTSIGTVVGVCDNSAVPACNSYNRDPVWVGGSQNNTQVRVDLDADDLWDFVDINSDNCPDNGDVVAVAGTCENNVTSVPPGCAALTANQCVYLVDAPGSLVRRNVLRVWDHVDQDNAGTRIVSTRPVALSWGEDTDQGQGGDPSPDNGYTIYPPIALDLVIGVEKTVSPLRVPLAGTNAQRTATYTVRIFAGDYGPLTFVTPRDTLPPGITCSDYVVGSTLITYPDNSTSTDVPTYPGSGSPTCTVLPSGRSQLTWAPTIATLLINQETTITYQILIPASATPRSLENEAEVTANLGSSVFNPKDTAILNQSDLTIVKGVTDDGSPEVGDTLTYTVAVRNGGTVESNVSITDAIPSFTTFVAGSINAATSVSSITQAAGTATVTMPVPHNYITGATITIAGAGIAAYNGAKTILATPTPTTFTFAIAPATLSPAGGTITATPSSAPLVGTYSTGANAITWAGTPFAANAVAILTFQVRITDSTPSGSLIPNTANYSSTLIPTFDSNTVITTVLGPQLVLSKTGPPGPVNPNDVLDYELLLQNTGTGAAKAVGISDNLASTNTTYVAGSTSFSVNGGPFTAVTDAQDVDRFNFTGSTLSFAYFRPVATMTRAGATVTVTTSVPHFFANGNSVTIAGADDPAYNGTFVIGGVTATTFTYTVVGTPATPATGVLTAELNPTFSLLPGSTLRLRFKARVDPGTGGLFATNQANAVATGQPSTPSNLYQVPIVTPPGVVSISKASSAGGTATPGQILTYTVVVANDTAVTQTNTVITDSLPTGTTFVAGSASVSTAAPTFRTTEYYVAPGAFTAATFNLTLNQNLVANYFVITQGSDFVDAATDLGPNRNYISLTGDPFGTGAGGAVAGLANTGVANRLAFTRGAASGVGQSWSGVITVVECLSGCTTAGFQLRDVGRIAHAAAAVGPTAVVLDAAGQWTAGNAGRIMLLGGFQGAGCDTVDADVADAKTCHARIFPTGSAATSSINWTRDATGATSLGAATSTVMVVEWGSEWTVNRQTIAGANGGAGINVVGEYNNSAAFAAVPRARTWVWGTGHTNNNEQARASEGVALTLGNGVTQNVNETILSAGMFIGQTKSFETYALTHPSLLVDHRFKAQDATADPTTATFDQTTTTGGGARVSLSYMAVDMDNNAYPQSMFSARYLSPSQIRLERRRVTGSFAAWTQGINFSNVRAAVVTPLPARTPPNMVVAGDGFTIAPGGTLTLTYQVTVNASPGTPTITNTATYTSTQVPGPGISATVVDNVALPGVRVEPNNAGFVAVPSTPAGNTILFTQGVTNLGNTADSFAVTLNIEKNNWKLELIDPATGSVIATDTNGDGVWDGGVTVSTGSLAVGETKQYTIRATVPNGTAAGFQNTVELTATSALSAAVKDVGTDEITVLSSTYFGPIVLLPDHSGIVAPGGTIPYTHRLFNNTGAPARFDLTVSTQLGWTTEIHTDTNGDGVYTPGVDVQISNSSLLANGASEILFVVTTAPPGATPGIDDVAHLTARSQAGCTPNPACLAYVDSVTDTTTILAATTHDLAGGGTRMAAVGDLTTFPGTIYNLSSSPDSFDFNISASSLFGVDGLNHPTELVVDTNADGVADTLIAVDTNGDGTWDLTCGAGVTPACSAATFKNNGDAALPDVLVPANGKLAYELRRQIDPAQKIWLEYATLTATSVFNNTQKDSVTAEWIIASLSRASIRGLRVDTNGFVEFVTGSQKDTAFFNLYSTADRSLKGEKTLLNTTPIASPMPDSVIPILYKVQTRSIDEPYLIIEETETTGNVFSYGPYSVANTRLLRGLERVEDKMNRFGITDGPVRVARAQNARRAGALGIRSLKSARVTRRAFGTAANGLALEVSGSGQIAVPIATLQSAGLPNPAPPSGNLSLTRNGQVVSASVSSVDGMQSLAFEATALTTDYAENSTYILTWPGTGAAFTPTANFSIAGDPARPGYVRIERNAIYAVAVAPGSDPWQWGFLIGDGRTWPYADWDPTVGGFDLPMLGVTTPAMAPVKIRFVGRTDHHHLVSAQINGYSVGTVSFDNQDAAVLEGNVPQTVLRETGNELTFVYRAEHDDGSLASAGYAYMDYVDVAIPTKAVPSSASLASLRAYDPKVTGMNGVKYLIVTNSVFREQADRLAALKTAEKLKALVIDVQTAYDRFSGGVTEPNAIMKAIREVAQTSGKLEYVVLLGDDTFDPKNYLGADTVSYVPSILGWDGSQRIPNENAYADIDGDGSPDVALGRIPVNTAAEAKIVVDKIEIQTTTLAKGGNVHLFASDDSRDSDSKFGQNAAEMSQLLPATTTSILADVGAAGVGLARNTLFGTWQQGALMTHYFGHGGPEIWTDEALFSVDDVPDLQGHMSPTILLAWACQTQFFQNFYGPSINEAMFLSPASGSLASLGPVGITSPEHQKALYRNVYKWLYTKGLSLGEIIRQAKVAALAEDPANKDVVDGFMFLGDPSLSLPMPQFGNPGKGKIPR